jgi:hypothetical protein
VYYELAGQNYVLEQLFRVLSIHSQQLAISPIVAFLCGANINVCAMRQARELNHFLL